MKTLQIEITEKDYHLLRKLLERGYYSAKDNGNLEEMEHIDDLDNYFISMQPE
ncbi:hypothetical protein [Paenibacillus cremeus]|uniref:hypothetical protein n=1 Tax=Paenibacillus cremeus TaxID=2163881 RepID=UPI001647814B|nr:hypothetical protein [Paenibacillus cremeus]